MDKSGIGNSKKTNVAVFRFPPRQQRKIHQDYGLWIFRSALGSVSPPHPCRMRYMEFYSISHMYDGSGCFVAEDGSRQEVRPGDCVIVTPKFVNFFGAAPGGFYAEDTLNFCGPVADMLYRSGVIDNGVFPLGKVRKLRTISEYADDPSVDAQIRANSELQKLLVEIYFNRRRAASSEYPLLHHLLTVIQEQPEKWWSVAEMAEMCNLSPDQLRRVFFQHTGVTPKLYVDKLKLNRAAAYMISSGCSVADAASRFGYQDPYHFSRRFKAIMGTSPRRYCAEMKNPSSEPENAR